MGKQPTFTELGDKAPSQHESEAIQPAPEDELGGGDIYSVDDAPSTDDDKPLE